MATDNALKVAEALESGEFEQTSGTLRDEKGYCCLGVACETYRRETGEGEWTRDPGVPGEPPIFHFNGAGECGASLPPTAVSKWLGLDRISAGTVSLAQANDSGVSFSDIAEIIRTRDSLYS